MTEGEEVVALINSYYDQGKIPQDDPQLQSKLAAIKAKYAQQQPTQQQTTTQDTGALANVGTNLTDEEIQNRIDTAPMPDTQPQMLYGGDYSLETFAGGQPQMLYFTGSDGKSYVKRYAEDEFVYGAPPSDVSLTLTSVIAEDRNDNKFKKDVDPTQFQYGGKQTPEQVAEMIYQANKDDPSDNDVFYTAPNGQTYVDVTGTGQSIPVGSTNITRDPTQLGTYQQQSSDFPYINDASNLQQNENVFTEFDPSTYTQPVLTKGFTGYYPTGDPQSFDIVDDPIGSQPGASTNFTDLFSLGSGRFDVGQMFGLSPEQLVLSNPDANQFDLNKFFNQTESFGTQNFLRSQSTDVLNDIINEGNFFNALAGKNFKLADGSFYYDKIYNVVNDKIKDPDDLSRYGVDPSRGYGTAKTPLGLDEFSGFNPLTGVTGGAIQGFDQNQLINFFDDLRANKDPTTGDVIYSNTAYGTDPFNISGGDDSNALQYDYAYSQRPLTAQAVRAYKGGLGPYANVQYLTRYGYNPEIGDEILRYDEASGVYFDPVTGLPIKPERLEGFALSDPETVELGGTESVYRGQMTTDPITGEQLYYDAEGNPVTEEQYQLFTEPMETGVT